MKQAFEIKSAAVATMTRDPEDGIVAELAVTEDPGPIVLRIPGRYAASVPA